ncbi:hypothetical protein E1B28_002829 [Marasmius oreades]|nr:uncharacterized protein E1B28_002829 [Marasmius oreades]KAG7086913.1 hypothetical protein E1B28_002829 [Marasmius oreades]
MLLHKSCATSTYHPSRYWSSMFEPSQTSSVVPTQQILSGALNTTIGQAVFNNVGRDQNYFTGNPLWEAIADVGASHNSEQQVDRGRCLPGTRETVLKLTSGKTQIVN